MHGLSDKLYRADVQHRLLQHDLVFLLETFLQPDTQAARIPANIAAAFQVHNVCRPVAVGAHGGMLLLINNRIFQYVKLTSVDAAQGIAWLTVPGAGGSVLHVAACYIPPHDSVIHRRLNASSPWDTMQQYIGQHSSQPDHSFLLMGDFNAKTGGLPESADLSELQHALPEMPELAEYLQQDIAARRQTDTSSNAFGEQLLALLAANAMCVFNGRVPGENDGYTCFSTSGGRGRGPPRPSTVDYAAGSIDLLRSVQAMNIHGTAESDHSMLSISQQV